jgi:deoxyhypusine synthase
MIASIGITLPGNNDDHKKASETAGDAMPCFETSSKPLAADTKVSANPEIPSVSAWAVLGESSSMPADSQRCRGHEFQHHHHDDDNASNNPSSASSAKTHDEDENDELDRMMQSFLTTGFQATNLALAIDQIRQMRAWRLSEHGPAFNESTDDVALQDEANRRRIRARIFLAYTSNQISCGQREVLRFLVQHKMVDVIVTTAGGVEEDIIKCFQHTYMGDFNYSGRELRKKGINRIGNLLVPNSNYCEFEDWIGPLLHKMHNEQDAASIAWAKQVAAIGIKEATNNNNDDPLPTKFTWTPSKIIHRFGKEINNPDSVMYWAAFHDIPVFCPALTDGSIGDMIYFHSYKRPGFVVDIAQDIRRINDLAVKSHCTGQIILGGGLVKHHTCNANLMRNGADYSVYVNTASDYDGSDAGASPDEAISWGKIRITAKPVKVTCDATIAFPLIVSQTFAKNVTEWKESTKDCVCWVDDLVGTTTNQKQQTCEQAIAIA